MKLHIEECEQCGRVRFGQDVIALGTHKVERVAWSAWCPASSKKFNIDDPDVVSFDTVEECDICERTREEMERTVRAAGSVH